MMTTIRDFPHMRKAATAEAWEYLQDKYPDYARALQAEVTAGQFTPMQLRRFMVDLLGDWRDPMARRIELAAEWLQEAA
jgi:hypothetical protein